MNLAPKKGENLERKVAVTLTQRDMLLLKLCLELVNRDYTRGGALRFDIQSLRDKLSTQQRAPDDSTTGTKTGNQTQKRRKERR